MTHYGTCTLIHDNDIHDADAPDLHNELKPGQGSSGAESCHHLPTESMDGETNHQISWDQHYNTFTK